MDPNTLLAQLRDIHSPIPPGWWPPAVGWWLLLIIGISGILVFLVWYPRWRRRTAWKRLAIKEFRDLKERYLKSDPPQTVAELNGLLKRCAASASNEHSILSLTGENWANLLALPPNVMQKEEITLLSEGHYRSEHSKLDTDALNRMEKWIKRLESC